MWLLLKNIYSFINPSQPKARMLFAPARRAAA
jgi:hypothetical protein